MSRLDQGAYTDLAKSILAGTLGLSLFLPLFYIPAQAAWFSHKAPQKSRLSDTERLQNALKPHANRYHWPQYQHQAELAMEKQDYPTAEKYYRDAIFELVSHAQENTDLAKSYVGLATLYETTGKLNQAEPYFRKALAIQRRAPGARNGEVMKTLFHLSKLTQQMGRLNESEQWYRDAIAIENELVSNSQSTASEWGAGSGFPSDLSGDLAPLKTVNDAAKNQPDALIPAVDVSAESLAKSMGFYEQKPLLFGQHLEWLRNNPDALVTQQGIEAYSQKDYVQAQQLFDRAVRLQEKNNGEAHAETAKAMNNLAMACYAQGKVSQAKELLQSALGILKQTASGAQSLDVAAVYKNFQLVSPPVSAVQTVSQTQSTSVKKKSTVAKSKVKKAAIKKAKPKKVAQKPVSATKKVEVPSLPQKSELKKSEVKPKLPPLYAKQVPTSAVKSIPPQPSPVASGKPATQK